jgi:hypothetical protein
MKTIALSVIIMGVVLGCQNSNPTQTHAMNTADRQAEMTTGTGPTAKLMKPPIDVSAPVKTETATFAMG